MRKHVDVVAFHFCFYINLGAGVAQSVECLSLSLGSGCDLGVMRSSPKLGSMLIAESVWDSSPAHPPRHSGPQMALDQLHTSMGPLGLKGEPLAAGGPEQRLPGSWAPLG